MLAEQRAHEPRRRRAIGPQHRLGHPVVVRAEREHVDVVVEEVERAEHVERRRHGDQLAHSNVGERHPPTAGEQRVLGGEAHRAAAAGAHPVERLVAVGVEPAEHRVDHPPVVGERRAGHRRTRRSELVPLLGGADHAGDRVGHRRVPGHALAHGGAGADDVERARLQAGQDLVEVVEARGRAGDGVAAIEGLLQLVHRQRQQVTERTGAVDHPVLGHLEHLGLGLVEGLGDVVGLGVSDLGDLARHGDHPPQQRRVLDDLGVTRRVRHRRCGVLQIHQHLRATHLVEQAVAAQLVGNRHHVDGLATGHQAADRGVDVLVRRLVEVLDLQAQLGHRAHHIARQQQRAEQALLGVEVVWRHSAITARRRAAPLRGPIFVTCRHRTPTFVDNGCGSLEVHPCVFPGDNLPGVWTSMRPGRLVHALPHATHAGTMTPGTTARALVKDTCEAATCPVEHHGGP